MTLLAPTLQTYFTDRLIRERRVSPHTISAYRDTARLLVTFAAGRAETAVSKLTFDDLDAKTIGAFLDHLEHDRGCTPRTRNARLAAIRSFYRYAALSHPEHAATNRTRPRNPAQTTRPHARDLAHRPRTRRDPRRARP